MIGHILRIPRAVAHAVAIRVARRRALRIERHAIAELPENVVGRIVGEIALFDGQWLEAPLTKRTCVYYSVTVEEHVVSRGALRTLGEETRGVPFVLLERGQRAIVDPDIANISAAFDHGTECNGVFDAPPVEREVLERLKLVRRDWFLNNGLRFREAILEVGETVAVVGAGTREPDPDAPAVPQTSRATIEDESPAGSLYREAPRTRLRIAGTPRAPITITDDPDACR